MYLECLVLSNQFEQAQKKWLEVLNKMYILEPADKIKLKEILEKLNSYKRQVS
jgi:transketolase C-terminal domain/subunit